MSEEWMTTTQAAEHLGVSDARVRQLIIDGALPAQKFGRAHMIRVQDLKDFERPKMGRPPKEKEEPVVPVKKRASKK